MEVLSFTPPQSPVNKIIPDAPKKRTKRKNSNVQVLLMAKNVQSNRR
jgi:hypothetical protein